VEDIESVEHLEAVEGLYEYAPDVVLLEDLLLLLGVGYLLVEVAIVRELHDDATLQLQYHRFLP